MKASVTVLMAFVFLLLQMVAVNRMAIGKIAPDFPLLFVTYIAMRKGSFQGSILGFIVGLVQDLFNPALLGLNAMIKSILGYAVGVVGSKTISESAPFIALVFFIAKLGGDLVYTIFFFSLDFRDILLTLFTVSLPSAVYTALIGILIHEAFSFLSRRMVKGFGKAQQ